MAAYIVLVCLHISAAAVVLGASLTLSGDLRRALGQGDAVFKHAAHSTARKARIADIAALLTVGLGLGLIFFRGGFGVVTKNYHAALGLWIIAAAVSGLIIGPAMKRAKQAAESTPVDEAMARGAIKKTAMGSGIMHTIWLTTLVLMFYRF